MTTPLTGVPELPLTSHEPALSKSGTGVPALVRESGPVARFGTPVLYRNQRNGTFQDVSAASGMTAFANTIAVVAFDFDRDSRLDLLFGNYFPPENLIELKSPHVLPNDLDNAVNGGGVTLWRNLGGGRFEDVTARAGVAGRDEEWGTTASLGDVDGDGDLDALAGTRAGELATISEVHLGSPGSFSIAPQVLPPGLLLDLDGDGDLDSLGSRVTFNRSIP